MSVPTDQELEDYINKQTNEASRDSFSEGLSVAEGHAHFLTIIEDPAFRFALALRYERQTNAQLMEDIRRKTENAKREQANYSILYWNLRNSVFESVKALAASVDLELSDADS